MRLLQRLPDNSFELVLCDDDNLPPYAILSHTWIEGREVTYSELVAGLGTDKTGYDKIRFCVDRAAEDGLQYCWIDTCCIDKSASNELSTAINSMFRWYQGASKCYVYLSDVQVPDEVEDAQAFPITWKGAFQRSRWFRRGWTLQELLAPATVEFFSKDYKRLGSKISLEQEIHTITNIPIQALRGQNLTDFSIAERRSWVAQRSTTVKEDIVYCLLGICGVFLPLIYGEGKEYATARLEEEIQKRQRGQGIQSLQDMTASDTLPFPRNELFMGRGDKLQTLEQFFVRKTHHRMTVFGIGGCGKSALVLEFAYRILARHAGHLVFWVPAISKESFELAYREIGIRLNIPGITDDDADIKELVKVALASRNMRDWLMIVDNADDPGVLMHPKSTRLYDYLPYTDKGKIVFTTRNRKAAGQFSEGSVLKLDHMSMAEARDLLSRRITNQALLDDETVVDGLLEILTYLPLAIVQAAAFINNNDITVSGYMSLFKETGNEAELFGEPFEDPSRYRDMDSTVAKTWHISFDQIRNQDVLAARYLSFMACIDRIGIPLSLLPPGDSPVHQVKAIGTLKGYAFITERQQALPGLAGETCFDMHRLIHMASVWWLKGYGEQKVITDEAAARLQKLIPDGGHEGRQVWTSYLPHAIHIARVDGILADTMRASLLERVGSCQYSLGQYSAAEATFREVVSRQEKIVGKNHEDTMVNMGNVALMLFLRGKYKEAEALDKETLALKREVLGKRHPHTLVSMNNLAETLIDQGKYEEAEALHRETLALSEDVFGKWHPQTLTSMNNLANTMAIQGESKETEALHRKTLILREDVLGKRHPDTLVSMSNLAETLVMQGKYKEAEVLHRETLTLSEDVLGKRHPATVVNMNNLANTLANQGKNKEAEALQRETLTLSEDVLGKGHPDTLRSVYCLACVLAALHRYDEAVILFQTACNGFSVTLGDNHPTAHACRRHYDEVLRRQDQSKRASMETDVSRPLRTLEEEAEGVTSPATICTLKG